MISLSHLVKTFEGTGGEGDAEDSGRVVAVDDVSIDVKAGEFFTLLGPSGCGKTTTLRMLAGLATPDSGQISLRDKVLFDSEEGVNVPPHRRGLGMVFQSYAIWPHMTVAKNVAFPLGTGLRGHGRARRNEVSERVSDVLRLVELGGLEDRPATDLSGGQQQRLALARALVTQPDVLLLDEPLSNLDAKLRETMRFELKKIQRELGITTVYVTHDQTEALGLSNKIAVINAGHVEQVGHPRDIYERPKSHFVADFIGISNFIPGTIEESLGSEQSRVKTSYGDLVVRNDLLYESGADVTISIRPEHVTMTEDGRHAQSTSPNTWIGRVEARAFEGDAVQHQVRVDDLLVRVKSHPSQAVHTGSEVELTLPREWCTIIPAMEAAAKTVPA